MLSHKPCDGIQFEAAACASKTSISQQNNFAGDRCKYFVPKVIIPTNGKIFKDNKKWILSRQFSSIQAMHKPVIRAWLYSYNKN
jgi:hypothetical protein